MKTKQVLFLGVAAVVAYIIVMFAIDSEQMKGEEIMPVEDVSIEEIVQKLKDDDIDVRDRALEQLEQKTKKGLSSRDAKLALYAAAENYPPNKYEFIDTASKLIEAAGSHPDPELIGIIKENFNQYSVKAMWSALRLLSDIDDRNAAVAYMALLDRYAEVDGVTSLPTQSLNTDPRFADVYFPGLLDYAGNEGFEWNIYMLLLKYSQQNRLASDDNDKYTSHILSVYKKYEDKLFAAQKSDGVAWMWSEEYQKGRSIAELMLDIMGYFPTTEIDGKLREALKYKDPRLKHFAVISLLRKGKAVSHEAILDVARSPEMRNFLYEELVKLKQLSLYPVQYRTQQAFAESDMVNWLVYPTELGRVPDDIELMEVVSVDTDTDAGVIDYYVFRFRTDPPHWASEKGWLAGVSGPFLRKDSPTTEAYGETFSVFESWDSKTAEEHVGNIQEVMERWHEYNREKQQ